MMSSSTIDKERGEELGVNGGRYPRDEPRQPVDHRLSRRRDSEVAQHLVRIEADPEVLHAQRPARSTSEVRKVWSTSPCGSLL